MVSDSEAFTIGTKGLEAHSDVLVEFTADLGSTIAHVVTTDGSREFRVLQFLEDYS